MHKRGGGAQTPGQPCGTDTQRAELFGIYAIHLCFEYVCRWWEKMPDQVKLIYDYKGVLMRAMLYNNRLKTRHLNFDLLWAIFDLCNKLIVDIIWRHMSAYQEKIDLVLDLKILNI